MKPELSSLDSQIRSAHIVVIFIVAATILGYGLWFGLVHSQDLSKQTEIWGHFGAFAGGLLGPLVAYAAFYWLTKSVRLQKEELAYTRNVLQNTSESQSQHAEHASTSVRVAALSALINSVVGDVQVQRLQLQFVVDQMRSDPNQARFLDGRVRKGRDLLDYLEKINSRIRAGMTKKNEYEQTLEALIQIDKPNNGFKSDAGRAGAG